MHLLEKNILDHIECDKESSKHNYYYSIVIDGKAELQALNTNNLVTFNGVRHQLMEKIIINLYLRYKSKSRREIF